MLMRPIHFTDPKPPRADCPAPGSHPDFYKENAIKLPIIDDKGDDVNCTLVVRNCGCSLCAYCINEQIANDGVVYCDCEAEQN